MQSHLLRLLLTATCCFVFATARSRAGDAASGAAMVPAEVELLIVVDDAAAWRTGPGGPLLIQLSRGATADSDLVKAWRGLAGVLQIDGDRAFDDLLGRRVIFAQRDAKEPGGRPPWVVVSVVSHETEALLRKKLNPAPRRVKGGLSVLALEDGRFWLASVSGKSHAVVMLGPAAESALFDQMLPTLGRNASPSLLGSKMGEDIRSIHPGAGAIMFSRRRDDQGRLILVGVAAKRGPDGVLLGLIARSQAIAECVRDVRPTSRAIFDSIAPGAYFAAMEWDVPGLLGAMGLELPDFALPHSLLNFDGGEWLGPRRAYRIGKREEGGIEAAAALQSTDLTRLAPSGDRAMASILESLWGPDNEAELDAETIDFGGKYPSALREVDIAQSQAARMARAWLKDPRAAWTYIEDAAAAEEHKNGWWVVGLGAPAVNQMTTALATRDAAPDEEESPWISMGIVRPAALTAAIREAGMVIPAGIAPAFDAADSIESLEWSLRRADGGSIRGEATVRFTPKAGAP